MTAYHVIIEKFTNDYYINAIKIYVSYSDNIKYCATVTSLETLDEIECIDCTSEKEAIAAYHSLIDLYERDV